MNRYIINRRCDLQSTCVPRLHRYACTQELSWADACIPNSVGMQDQIFNVSDYISIAV